MYVTGGCRNCNDFISEVKNNNCYDIKTGLRYNVNILILIKICLQRGRPRKTWWDWVKNDMDSLGLSQKDAQFKNKWRRRIRGQPGKMAVKMECVSVYVFTRKCVDSRHRFSSPESALTF